MPLDEEPLNIFNNSKTFNSLTKKRAKSNPSPYTQSKLNKTLSKRSKSLTSLMKSNSVSFYNASSNAIDYKNTNIYNKFYIDLIQRRHNKTQENHKKILDIMDLNNHIKLKEKVTKQSKKFSGTLKKRSTSKTSSPTSIMEF